MAVASSSSVLQAFARRSVRLVSSSRRLHRCGGDTTWSTTAITAITASTATLQQQQQPQQSLGTPTAKLLLQQQLRPFSTSNSAAAATATQPQPDSSLTFSSEKVRDLFQRITNTCSKTDVQRLATVINDDIFGRPMRQNEFYYRGFGGRGGGGGAASGAVATQENKAAAPVKTTVDLRLTGFDAAAKIKVIKEVRAIAGLGLKEAKDLVEGAPATIQKDLKPEQAEELKAKLEELGATIELV